jgi:hypothetical protein
MFGLCCYTSDTGQAEVAIWNTVRGLSPNHRNGKRYTPWSFCLCCEKPGESHTTKMGRPTLVLINHFGAKIIIRAFLNQGCARPTSGFECHFNADVAECNRWITHLLGILPVEQTLRTSETITLCALASNWQRTVSYTCMTRWPVCLLEHVRTTSYRPPVTHICRFVLSHSLVQRERCGWYRNSGNIFEFNVQKYITNRHFYSWDKIFVDQCFRNKLKGNGGSCKFLLQRIYHDARSTKH